MPEEQHKQQDGHRQVTPLNQYLQELAQSHRSDPDFRTEFACYFSDDSNTLNLLEVSPTVLDPGDEEFYGVNFAIPPTEPPMKQVRIILVAPEEFDRARSNPSSPGGQLLERLISTTDYHVLVGEDTHYARELQHSTH